MYEKINDKYGKIFKFNQAVVDLMDSYSPQGGDILDVGCGRGRYSASLSKLGYKTVGIDPDSDSIERGKVEYPKLPLYKSDLLGYSADTKFDLIFCIGNAISHIYPQDIEATIDKVYALLKPGGIWIFHTINWDLVLEQGEYTFPVLEREGLKFERWYKNVTKKR